MNFMRNFIFKDDGDSFSALVDASQDNGSSESPNSDPASTISADNGEVINLDTPPVHTKD